MPEAPTKSALPCTSIDLSTLAASLAQGICWLALMLGALPLENMWLSQARNSGQEHISTQADSPVYNRL
jgi:hypothetical protein